MTDHLDQLRAKLHARIREVSAARRASTIASTSCSHSWEHFRQTVLTENAKFEGTAYFIVKGCRRCKRKVLLDYVVG